MPKTSLSSSTFFPSSFKRPFFPFSLYSLIYSAPPVFNLPPLSFRSPFGHLIFLSTHPFFPPDVGVPPTFPSPFFFPPPLLSKQRLFSSRKTPFCCSLCFELPSVREPVCRALLDFALGPLLFSLRLQNCTYLVSFSSMLFFPPPPVVRSVNPFSAAWSF